MPSDLSVHPADHDPFTVRCDILSAGRPVRTVWAEQPDPGALIDLLLAGPAADVPDLTLKLTRASPQPT